MKRHRVLLVFIFLVSFLWGADFSRYDAVPIRTFTIGSGLAGLQTKPDWDYPKGPTAIAFDARGRLFVCDGVGRRLVVADRSLAIIEAHTGIQSGATLRFEVGDRGISNHHYFDEFSFVDWDYEDRFLISYEDGRYDNSTQSDSSMYYGNVVFTYLRDGSLISVPFPSLDWRENERKILDPVDTRTLFKEPEKYGLVGLTLDERGRLFIDGEIATRSYRVYLGWCEEQGGGTLVKVGNAAGLTRDPHRSLTTATYHGKDMNGNVYWHAGDTVLTFNRAGAVIEMLFSQGGIGIGTVHPSGDLYGISYDDKGVYLHRIRNVWDPKARELWEAYVISTTGEGIRSAEVTAGPLRVRRAAGPMAEIEGELAKGDRVEVLCHGSEKDEVDGMSEYWYEVRRTSDRLQGWVFGGYLRIE